MKVALYNPFIETLGGGEKHILSIIQVFAEQGAEISIFWNKNLTHEIENRFSFEYVKNIKWLPNIFNNHSPLRTLQSLKNFDYFFYVTNGSYFASLAKKNFVFSMVPDQKLYNLNPINRLKLWNYRFISNSPFTTSWLEKWGINPITIPPYIDSSLLNIKNKKEKIILSVGRFFPHLHSKNQEKIIESFSNLKRESQIFRDYKLIIVGGLKKEDESYFNKLKLSTEDPSILFKPNVTNRELYSLYGRASYFWHFTGYGVDEDISPEKVEHFGIAPLEAMAASDFVFCFNAGGPKRLIKEGETGFLFNDIKELIEKMIILEGDLKLQNKIKTQANSYIDKYLSYNAFKTEVLKFL